MPTCVMRWWMGLGACHPDPFLLDQLNLDAERLCMAMRQHRASLKNPRICRVRPVQGELIQHMLHVVPMNPGSGRVLDFAAADFVLAIALD